LAIEQATNDENFMEAAPTDLLQLSDFYKEKLEATETSFREVVQRLGWSEAVTVEADCSMDLSRIVSGCVRRTTRENGS
jgi:hypothetical protein